MNLVMLQLHTDPQARCMIGKDRRWAVDYIIRAEHSDEDVAGLVDLINSRLPPETAPLPVHHLSRNNT